MSVIYIACLFFILSCFTTCTQAVKNSENETLTVNQNKDTMSIQGDAVLKNTIIMDSVGNCPPYNGHLPFGCEDIKKLPDTINIDFDNRENSVLYKRYSDIIYFYQLLKNEKTVKLPQVKSILNIELGHYFPFKNSAIFIDSVKYQLPNFGPYQCFYSYTDFSSNSLSYERNKDKEFAWADGIYVTDLGNLILYDPLSRTAKVINIFFLTDSYGEEGGYDGYDRLFYIGKDQLVTIYKIRNTGEGGYVAPEIDFTLNVSEKGEIIVKNPSGKIIKTYER